MNSIKDSSGIWFELNKVCDLLALTTLEVLYSPIKDSFPKQFLQLKNEALYINSFGFILLASFDRSGQISIEQIQNCILDAMRCWSDSSN